MKRKKEDCQEEKYRSAVGNAAFLVRTAMKKDRWYPVKALGGIVSELAVPFLGALLPATAVALLTGRASAGWYLLSMGVVTAIYGIGQFMGQFLNTLAGIRESGMRLVHFLPEYYHKSLTMDYCNLEPERFQLRQNEALNSIMDPHCGVEAMMQMTRLWVLNLAGLFLYGSVAASLEPVILLVLAGMVTAHYVLAWYSRNFFQRTSQSRFRLEAKLNYLAKQAEESGNGKDARVYGMEKWFGDSMRGCVKRLTRWHLAFLSREYLFEASDSIFVLLRDLIAYSVLVKRFLEGSLDAAGFTMTLGLVATFSRWLDGFIRADTGLRLNSRMIDNYRNFIDTPDVMNHGAGADIEKLAVPPEIELREVSFTYPGAENPAISKCNLKIRRGEKIALVGVNGAGKTTLVKLLSGMYLPTEGTVLVDGVPAEKFQAEEFYRLTATLYQDVNVMPCTIAENIACREEYDRGKVMECLKTAGLLQAVEKLPKGIDTSLTQKLDKEGVQLSGGQMQRLLFARALYRDSPILILDEPTAALDPLAEADLYQRYAEQVRGKTSIFISHRLSSTQFCDRILFMENGRLAEEGSHAELLKRGGRYAEMFRVQSHYYT